MSLAATALESSYFGALLRAAMAAVGVVLFFTGLDNYAFRFLGAPSPILFVVVFVGAAVLLALLELRAPQPLLRSPVLLWVIFYFVLTVTWAIFMKDSLLVRQVLNSRLRSIGLVVAFAIVFSNPLARRVAVWSVVGAVAFAAVLNVAELAGIVRFEQQELFRTGGRSGGLYVNPNASGLAIVLGLAVAVIRVRESWRVPLLVVGAIGVLATFSRGAQVCFIALIVLLAWKRQLPIAPLAAIGAGVIVLVAFQADSILDALMARQMLNENTWARLRLEQGDSGRAELARAAWLMFVDSPILGKGLGATVDWTDPSNSSHNQFLNLAGDHGILGLLTFPALGVALVARNPGALPFAAVLMLSGLISHNLLEDRSVLFVVALTAMFGDLEDADEPAAGDARCAA